MKRSRYSTRRAATAASASRKLIGAGLLALGFASHHGLAQSPIWQPPCPPNMSCAPGTPPSTPTPMPTPTPAPPSCAPGAGGTPCNAAAGNPINTMTGNKFQREVDMAPLPGVLGLEIVRYYNSAFSGTGSSTNLVGRGWKLSYEVELHASTTAIQIVEADGTRRMFSRDPRNPSLCASADPAQGTVRVARGRRGDEFVWQQNDGTQLSFSSAGKLTQILAPTGEFVTLQHDRTGLLLAVTDPQGRQLRLNYLDKLAGRAGDAFRGVQSIDTPLGRYGYGHGAPLPKGASVDKALLLASLVSVRYPDKLQGRDYHYEDARHPTLLTGISVREGTGVKRLSTYGYGADGRATDSTLAGNSGRVRLDFSQAGQTVLTNSLGQKTVYRYAVLAGEYRLLEVRGAGCAQCSEPNIRYGYDDLGRLVEAVKLDDAGRPVQALRTELDSRGRPVAVRRIRYTGGKPGAPQLVVRHEYAQFDAPTLSARPSVVEGRETVTRISYNAHGQPLTVSDSGWAPASGPNAAPQPIARAVRYTYRIVNGRSLLAAIDGPLANGNTGTPADSDITRFDWDERGNRIVSTTAPGNTVDSFGYDAAGRIVRIEGGGTPTTLGYDGRGRISEVGVGGVLRRTRYDALGNPVEVGTQGPRGYTALARNGFDDAGRHVWSVSHLGVVERRRLDGEGHVLERSMRSGAFASVQRYEYDELGRVVASVDGDGAVRRMRYDLQGRPALQVDALDRATRYDYDGQGRLSTITPASNTPFARLQPTAIGFEYDAQGNTAAVHAPTGGTTRTVYDDFGRAVAVDSPDSGLRTHRYDEAGRLVASRDALGNSASYAYDVAGRIVRQVVTQAVSGKVQGKAQGKGQGNSVTTEWKYEGGKLVALEHPDQRESYRYDDQGRIVARSVSLVLGNGRRADSTARYRYDEEGRLASSTLPDGSLLEYQRGAQGQIVGLKRHRIQTAWLRWLLPSQTVVADVTGSVAGITGYTYGNGVQARLVRGPNGMLAQVLHRRPETRVAGTTPPPLAGLSLDRLLGLRPAHAATPAAAAKPAAKPNDFSVLGALGAPAQPGALIDYRYLWDVQGNLLYQRGQGTASDYAYDAQDRLIAAASGAGAAATLEVAQPAHPAQPARTVRSARYFYDGAGNRVLAQEDAAGAQGGTQRVAYHDGGNRAQPAQGAAVEYDAAGQPLRADGRAFSWDAHGRLLAVTQDGTLLASYRYNHRGERIAKVAGKLQRHFLYRDRRIVAELDADGKLLRQYLYLGNMPVEVIDSAGGKDLADGERSAVGQVLADIGSALAQLVGGGERLGYLHHNHLGAPEVVSDEAGKPVWQASYAPYGQLIRAAGPAAGFEMNLRLPGQYEDGETGLYYNDHRYYDPRQGRYLSPDPLGLRAGINTYAYVAGNPLKYVDPSGLILFAFDGTGNSSPAQDGSSLSNVRKFYEAYDIDNNGPAFYITGIGTTNEDMPIKGNILNGKGFDERVALGFRFLDEFINDDSGTTTLDIDVIGFSRGAAEARVWINLLVKRLQDGKYTSASGKSRCLSLRFEGLWDTVPHLGYLNGNESKYDFSVPEQVKFAAHAVALNEHRGDLIDFDGRSILQKPTSPNGGNRIEMGFVGSHSDIGGGYGTGDLSDVALMWMIKQAKDQGIKFRDPFIVERGWTTVTNPILHDKSGNNIDPGSSPERGDREFVYGDGTRVRQSDAVIGHNTAWAKSFVNYYYVWCGPSGSPAVGLVDMQKYSAWLETQGVNIGYAVPSNPQPCS